MPINARTKVISLIGYPVEHSLSPSMHNAAFAKMDLNFCYVALPVRAGELADAVSGVRALNFRGLNVTVPYKEEIIPLLDDIDKEARFIGAVNTVRNDDGVLKGFNTDGRGFMESLREANIDIRGRDVLIIGAGGASRAISYYIMQSAKRVSIYDIAHEKCSFLVQDLRRLDADVVAAESLYEAVASDIIINATPVGLNEDDPLPLSSGLLNPSQTVCDLIYWDTPLIRQARELGCKTLNGLGMLLWQGVLAFQIWTGLIPPVDVMRDILTEGVKRRK